MLKYRRLPKGKRGCKYGKIGDVGGGGVGRESLACSLGRREES